MSGGSVTVRRVVEMPGNQVSCLWAGMDAGLVGTTSGIVASFRWCGVRGWSGLGWVV